MVVHPGAGNRSGTLANALCFRRLNLGIADNLSDHIRPGIVHRLDKDTSGLIITAWDDDALFFLSSQFRQRKVTKTYAAIVQGCPKQKQGRIDQPIGRSKTNRKLFSVDPNGKPSLTLYRIVKTFGNYSLLLLRPKTGRTHQLRVHLKHIGHPILGDPLYNKPDPRFPALTLMLHAKRLTIRLPETGIKTFRTVFPQRFKTFIKNFGKRS
jgi:23S rRNA pseudouridine1911/1915/1917 synthase